MNDNQTIDGPNLAIVEGKDDQNFLRSLIIARSLPSFHVVRYEGKDKLRRFLKVLPVTPGFEKVGALAVFRDADQSAENASVSVRNALAAAKLPAPDYGGAVKVGTIRTIFFISPDNGSPGEIEDCCNSSVVEDVRYPVYGEFLARIEEVTGSSLGFVAKRKVQLHLALQVPRPLEQMGPGAKAGAWPLQHAAFDGMANALRDVAVAAEPAVAAAIA